MSMKMIVNRDKVLTSITTKKLKYLYLYLYFAKLFQVIKCKFLKLISSHQQVGLKFCKVTHVKTSNCESNKPLSLYD